MESYHTHATNATTGAKNVTLHKHEWIDANFTNTETIYDGTGYKGELWPVSNTSHEATFWYNGSYSGWTPRCATITPPCIFPRLS